MSPSREPERLESWKEIAAYLHRDVRTVQRWEKKEGLPVHRHLHEQQGSVYAFPGEIDQWLEKRRHPAADTAPGDAAPEPPQADPVTTGKTAGTATPLKEYSLGVFGRGDSFGLNTDTIVRAQRLRPEVEEYYEPEGGGDPIAMGLPAGQYIAEFWPVLKPTHEITPSLKHDVMSQWRGLPWPIPCSPLLGRDRELAEVKQMLGAEHIRLLSLTGAGGSGKTRLALQAAAEMRDHFPGGLKYAALASVTDAGTVASTLASVFHLRHTGGRPVAEVLPEFLRDSVHAPTLLFLDNFEQVLAAASLLTSLLERCPPLKIFVTSRAVLHVSGEHEYPLLPLPVPDPNHLPELWELSKNPAVALFVQRAAACSPTFGLTGENARAIAEICERLDGLPLALELAAARVKILTPAAILERLGNPLNLLTGGPRDLPARQQSLRQTIDWSHSLLTPAEQMLFRRLAVFEDGCTLESAEAVGNPREDLESDLLEVLSSLVDQSLLQSLGQESGEFRFSMLETIRGYTLERLAANGEGDFTRRAHAAYFLLLVEDGISQVTEQDRVAWLSVWDAEHKNLRIALDWMVRTGNGEWALRLGTALYAFWDRREHLSEGREWLEAILHLPSAAAPSDERARAAWYAANFAEQQGDLETAIRLHLESHDIYSQLGDQKGMAAQLGYVGNCRQWKGDLDAARALLEQSLQACREIGDRSAIAGALNNLAEALIAQGEYAPARAALEEALKLFQDLGNQSAVGWSLNHLGDLMRNQSQLAEARLLYHNGLETFRSVEDRWGVARSFVDLGCLASEQNDFPTAFSLFDQAVQIFAALHHNRGIARVLEGLACAAVRKGDFDAALMLGGAAEGLRHRIGALARREERARFDSALKPAWRSRHPAAAQAIWADGWKMPLEQVIQCVPGMRTPADAIATGS